MTEFIQEWLGVNSYLQVKIFNTFITLSIAWILQRLLIRFVIDNLKDAKLHYLWGKWIKYFIAFFVILILIRVWFGAFTNLGTYFGLVSAGLAIALKDLIVNVVGWIFIIIREPFKVGDRIEIDDINGDVIDIRLFQFSVIEIGNWVDADQSTGRIIHIPNGIVFSKPQANYTAGFEYIWDEIPVLLTFESNWKDAKIILQNAVEKHAIHLSKEAEIQIKEAAKRFLIYYRNLTPIVYTSVKDSGVMLTLRYLVSSRSRRGTNEKIWEEILEQFATRTDIDFAYPTTRLYNNALEGKKDAKVNTNENK